MRCLVIGVVMTVWGCTSSHGMGDDAGPRRDGSGSLVDGGPRADGGSVVVDGGFREDSGRHPGDDCIAPDAGEPFPDAAPPPVEGCRDGEIWEGYIESYSLLPSGSDAVRIALDPATGDGARTGHVCFGAGTLLPPPVDPNQGYPPGLDSDSRSATVIPWEGFEYPILEGRADGSRIRLTIWLGDLWRAWCQLQTPIPADTSGEHYRCVPNTGHGSSGDRCWVGDPSSDGCILVDCGKLWLCMDVCDCTATECHPFLSGLLRFDFQVMGTRGDGSVSTPDGVHNVHMTHE